MLKADFFVLGDSAFDREQLRRRLRVAVSPDAQLVAVSSPEDLVLRKLLWYRAGERGRLDQPYLERWAAVLGVGDLLGRAFVESGTR